MRLFFSPAVREGDGGEARATELAYDGRGRQQGDGTMRTRPLGRTGLLVSEIGLGCASFWGKKLFNENDAIQLVHAAAARGVTFFDTGFSYSGGHAEPRLGRALAGLNNKHDLVVATKAGTRLGAGGRLYKCFSPPWIRRSVEASLGRLKLDTIPLLQLHGPGIADLTDELLAELARLRAEGKIRHLGVNSFDMPVIEHVMTLPLFGTVMIDYNILRPEREAIIARLAERGLGVLAGMALAGGLYSEQRFRIRGIRDIWYALRALKNNRADLARAGEYRFINHVDGWTGGQIALAWVLRSPRVACAVIGTTQLAHLLDNLQASGRVLDDAILTKIAAASREA
jgi:aryl-alcohol dehydrogenase-like predicted oxidoreductase